MFSGQGPRGQRSHLYKLLKAQSVISPAGDLSVNAIKVFDDIVK